MGFATKAVSVVRDVQTVTCDGPGHEEVLGHLGDDRVKVPAGWTLIHRATVNGFPAYAQTAEHVYCPDCWRLVSLP